MNEHKEVWRLVAYTESKEIYFCQCKSKGKKGIYYEGCGAVGIKYGKAGKMHIAIPPKFE